MSPPPARGWTHLQALLLAEVRAFSATQQLRTVDTRVSTLTGERFVDVAWRQKAAAPLEAEQAEVSTLPAPAWLCSTPLPEGGSLCALCRDACQQEDSYIAPG